MMEVGGLKNERKRVVGRELDRDGRSSCVFSFKAVVKSVSYFRPAVKIPILFEIPVEQTRGLS